MNIIFLDFDGVINTPIVNGKTLKMNYPSDKKVNNMYAVNLISKLCVKYNCKIVVISSWRCNDYYEQCLYNSGLKDEVDVIGCIDKSKSKKEGIKEVLDMWPQIEKYIVIDDHIVYDSNMVKCSYCTGFGLNEYLYCEKFLKE